ncbi:MAG: pyridoxamine 5'-phosphate oxidase family protein [Thermoproteota archaeon]|nr:pyridoxamine 5'-phosphate oxidase family protein [Thermoproteota archaeon]
MALNEEAPIRRKEILSILIQLTSCEIIQATSEIPGMTQEEVEEFLESKLNLQSATIDEQGYPKIHPDWFYHDKDGGKLWINTSKSAKKTQSIRKRPTMYFSIDDENPPVMGTKGRDIATIVEDPELVVSLLDGISLKYLGTLNHPIAKMISGDSKKGEVVLVEVNPKFFST